MAQRDRAPLLSELLSEVCNHAPPARGWAIGHAAAPVRLKAGMAGVSSTSGPSASGALPPSVVGCPVLVCGLDWLLLVGRGMRTLESVVCPDPLLVIESARLDPRRPVPCPRSTVASRGISSLM